MIVVLRARFNQVAALVALILAADAAPAESVRYFAVWSYTENAPREEIPADRVAERELGYWALELSDDGKLLGGTYHGADGASWLSLRYVEQDGRIYADLFSASGQLVARKSTRLTDLVPRFEE